MTDPRLDTSSTRSLASKRGVGDGIFGARLRRQPTAGYRPIMRGTRWWLASFAIALTVGRALAQPAEIVQISTQNQFSSADISRLAGWLEETAVRFSKARDQKERQRVTSQLTKLIDDEKATREFKARFGTEMAKAYRPLIGGTELDPALDIVVLLDRLPFAGTQSAMIAALASPHAAVRYRGAEGLRKLRGSLRQASEYEPVIDALAQAGAAETDPLVLRRIYEALDFLAVVRDFTGAEQVAKGISTVLEARLATLQQTGGRRPEADIPGFAAAARAFAALTDGTALKRRLATDLARFLAFYANRYGQLGPAGGGTSLREVAKACEDALAAMLRALDGAPSPPPEPQRVATRITAGADAKAVQQSLAAWIGGDKPGALNADPLKLPVGLRD